MEENLALQLRDNAKYQLEQIRDVETGIDYLNKVKAIETWAKAEKKDAELQNMIAEQKIRTQRILGKLIIEGQDKGEIAEKGSFYGNRFVGSNKEVQPKTLSDIGISRNESSIFQKVASIPDKEFEKEIKIAKEETNKRIELTTNRLLKVVKRIEAENKSYSNNEIPEGKYRIIYADPPWKYNDSCEDGAIQSKGAIHHYRTMTIKELCEMKLPEIDNNAVLFLWVTSPFLEDCFDIIHAWGFKYKASFVWDKVKHNMGHYNSVRHEFLLICTKGSCTPDNLKLFDSVVSIEKTEHSEKPEYFREIIDTIYPNGNRIELFARKKVVNWETWGNEI